MEIGKNIEEVKLPFLKILMDKTMAGIILIFTFPFFILIAIAIKIVGVFFSEDRGPVIYKERRISKDKPFNLYKIRILKVKAIEEEIKKGKIPKNVENTPENLTRVGVMLKKIGLDELPQIYNILKGEMSFVGPRPKPPPEYNKEIKEGIFNRKVIRAGLSGPAQVMKGTKRTREDELLADLEYINNCRYLSAWKIFLIDLSIIGRTIKVLFKQTGE